MSPGHHVPARFVSVIYNTPSSTTHAVSSARTAPINSPPTDQAPASTRHAPPETFTSTSRASTSSGSSISIHIMVHPSYVKRKLSENAPDQPSLQLMQWYTHRM